MREEQPDSETVAPAAMGPARETGAQKKRRLREVTTRPPSVRDFPSLRVPRGRRAAELATARAAGRPGVAVAPAPTEAPHA